MKKTILIAVAGLVALSGCSATPPATSGNNAAPGEASVTCEYQPGGTAVRPVTPPEGKNVSASGTVTATLTMNDQPVTLTLDRSKAPCTVNSFLSLASQGFYDGAACHRLSDSGSLLMLQCGDPSGTGTGGPGYQYADELAGITGYPAGTVAMANAGSNTNGSQFFLVYGDTQLPPKYTVFATMDAAGIAVIKAIAAGGQDNSFGAAGGGRPNSPAVITSVAIG